MRKNVKSLAPTLWLVIIAFIISIFFIWGGSGQLGESRDANVIATVGKDKISADLYSQLLRNQLEMLRAQYKEIDTNFIQQLNIPQQVLNQIIQQSLILQTAKDLGIKATDQEIFEKIKNYPAFQNEDGTFKGFEEYKKILEWNRTSISQFEESLKKDVLLEKTVKALTSGVAITQDELWESYKNNKESVRLEYIILETDNIEFDENIPEKELRDYFEKNQEKFKIPEKREADYVIFTSDELKNEIVPSDSDIENYYKENQSQFFEPEKIKVSRIYIPYEDEEKETVITKAQNTLERIQKGEDFGELAKLISKDEKASENGDWGLFEWKSLSLKEQEEIDKLPGGDISEPIELDEGISILKITEKAPSFQKPLETVKDRIAEILKDQNAREQVNKKVAQLEKSARKEKSLDAAAQKLGYRIKNSGLLKDGDPIEEIDTSGSISAAIFQLQEKEISGPVYTYKGTGIAQLLKVEPPRLANLEEVQNEVQNELVELKKADKALERMKKIKQELKRSNLETLAERYDIEYKTAEEHKRGQYLSIIEENSEVDSLAFSLPLEEASEPVKFDNGYVLIRPLGRKEVTKEEFETEKETERENLLEMKKNKFFQSYLSKIQENKGVRIKYDLLLKINSDVLSRFAPEK